MSTHDEIRTLIEDMQAGSKEWERESDARLKALNEQCDKLLAVIDAAQAGVKALNSADDGWIPWFGVGEPPAWHCQGAVPKRRNPTLAKQPVCSGITMGTERTS